MNLPKYKTTFSGWGGEGNTARYITKLRMREDF